MAIQEKILESADCSVVGIDKDPTAIELCRDLEKNMAINFYQLMEALAIYLSILIL